MSTISHLKIRNIAIIAHVDHGKTTLVDGLLWQSGLFRSNQSVQIRAMDSMDLERERGITLVAKNASIDWEGYRLNLVDTPGHSDFGGEVERGLSMVDGALLLVDAAEGPLPQTRFVLKHAIQLDLKLILVINKIDRQDARPKEVLEQVYDLFLELDVKEHQLDFPILYTDARKRIALSDPHEAQEGKDLSLLFKTIVDYIPSPKVSDSSELELLISNISYSDYLGRLGVGKLRSGTIHVGDRVKHWGEEGGPLALGKETKVRALFSYHGLEQEAIETSSSGDIVLVATQENLSIGDSITSMNILAPLPRIKVEPPTLSIELLVNSSPLAGKEGTKLTSRVLWERIERELESNVSLEAHLSGDGIMLKGRGELQFAVLSEQLRREGYEFSLGRPKVILKEENGKQLEPYEHLVIDIPEKFLGAITEKIGTRKGEMTDLVKMSNSRVRVEFDIPSRGLIGYYTEFLNDTRGEGLMSSLFKGYDSHKGPISERANGSLISDRSGVTTTYALFHLEPRGKLFIGPGIQVYEGMIVGQHSRVNDLNINVCREKKLTNIRAAGSDENLILTPFVPLTIESSLSWVGEDELLEVTPKAIRLRKRLLKVSQR